MEVFDSNYILKILMFLALTRWQMVIHYLHHHHNSYLHSVSQILSRGYSIVHLSNTDQRIYNFPRCSSSLKATVPNSGRA